MALQHKTEHAHTIYAMLRNDLTILPIKIIHIDPIHTIILRSLGSRNGRQKPAIQRPFGAYLGTFLEC